MTKHKSILLLIILFLASACSDEFLEKKPLGQLTSDNFFETEEHAVWATNAVYNMLRNWEVHVFSYIGMTDIVSDDADKGSTPNDGNFLLEIDDFTFDAGNIAVSTVWSGYYRGIYRANLAILNIPEIDMNANLRNRLVGENKFLRAYFYFNLVRWFGGVPLISEPLNPDEYKQPKASAAQVYAQIEQDLLDAIQALPLRYPAADVGRITKGAAEGLLAKVYLTIGDFPRAETHALNVINSGEYGLYSNYEELFQPQGENSQESVFEVQAARFETGGGGSQYNEVQGVRGIPNLGWGFNRPSDNLVASYEPGDPRRDATILYVGEVLPDGSDIVHDNPEIVNERYNQKAWAPRHPDGNNADGSGNIRILRYADILLIAAEALNETGKSADALTYLNMVRERARGGNPNILPNVTVTDRDQLRLRIWQERRSELAMEQHRWFDLLRQGRAAQVMQALGKNFIEQRHELFPIPQTEIDLSGGLIIQNQGY
jgi:starch-binding outer membrane protein, SusD/RagB family